MFRRCSITLTSLALLGAVAVAQNSNAALARPCPAPESGSCGYLPITVHPMAAPAVVTAYFAALNRSMVDGNMAILSTLFASGASVTENTVVGRTQVAHGTSAITTFFQNLRVAARGYQWRQERTRALAQGVILTYAHATSPTLRTAARSSNLFVISNGQIKSLDWTIFYSGVPMR